MSLKIDRRLNPCRASESMSACSTARGDAVCLACKRKKEDIDNWLTYSDEKKIEIMTEIENRIIAMRGFPS